MTKQDWRIERINDFKEAMAEASLIAEDFKALSTEFDAIADELLLGGKFESYNATVKSNEIRSLLARRNKVVRIMTEAVRDLGPDLKRAGILP